MDTTTAEVRLASWQSIIEACQNRPQGMTAKNWLADNGINEKTYYYHLRKVRKKLYEEMKAGRSLPAASSESICFTEISSGETDHLFSGDSSFRPDAVIQTKNAVIAVSNSISDHLLSALFTEVCHAR